MRISRKYLFSGGDLSGLEKADIIGVADLVSHGNRAGAYI